MSEYLSAQLSIAARATTLEIAGGWSSRGITARMHSTQAERVTSSSRAAGCPMPSVCCGVAAPAGPHRAAVATTAAIISIRFLRFMIAPSPVDRGAGRSERRAALLVTDREAAPHMLRMLELVDQCDCVIIVGDGALAVCGRDDLVAAQAELARALARADENRRREEGPL